MKDFNIRLSTEKDVDLILEFIKGLADYEKMSNLVKATRDNLIETLFEKKYAEVIIGEYKEEPVGFMLFFHNYSTFLGAPGLYLEDFYIKPKWRNNGFGKQMLSYLAQLAKERKCKRVEWVCLDWNEPSIKFYKSIGAIPKDEWTIFRLDEKAIDIVSSKLDKKNY